MPSSIPKRRIALLVVAALAVVVVVVTLRRGGDDVDLARIQSCTGQPVVPTPEVEEVTTPPVAVRLERVADVADPTSATVLGDGTVLVGGRAGTVERVDPATGATETVLDISDEVSTGEELGLLGLATDDERLWVAFTDDEWTVHVVAYELDGSTPDTATRAEVLSVDQPEPIHNGGHVLVGPDDMLYVGLGDSGDDYDAALRSQDLDDLHGKILRIDPYGSDGEGGGYGIPPDNPYVGRDDARPEVWLSGTRNPWRFSFDPDGALWIGDVGSNCWEEVDRIDPGASGLDLGWPDYEGFQQAVADEDDGASTFPVFDYPHRPACAVVGGYVLTDPTLGASPGTYVYADLCVPSPVRWAEVGDATVRTGDLATDDGLGAVVSFAEAPDGTLYVVDLTGGLYRLVPA